ncbi:hypothetical protein [Phyllobacterium sp. YR531]|uniref:putative quinol monooxygenase n=1 Tax=Phyllobacterium sp. YR531 TaxID=1144343 RepID=UPI00026FA9D2|nr:hypothetical protein [Phyllobacterium sp. YR531]EJN04184.1 hypothetical protein PMI41_01823 [Phyllobacterium sp. YR531]
MVTKGLYVAFEAKPGLEGAVADFLKAGLSIVNKERDTTAWFALEMGPAKFGIFDVFEKEDGRDFHLNGDLAKLLFSRADELFSSPPVVQKLDVIASKLP